MAKRKLPIHLVLVSRHGTHRTMCGIYPNTIDAMVDFRYVWRGVTCKNCLREKPKRKAK